LAVKLLSVRRLAEGRLLGSLGGARRRSTADHLALNLLEAENLVTGLGVLRRLLVLLGYMLRRRRVLLLLLRGVLWLLLVADRSASHLGLDLLEREDLARLMSRDRRSNGGGAPRVRRRSISPQRLRLVVFLLGRLGRFC
jgi:hypothetical protein